MFLQLAHTKLNAYTEAKEFTLECYKISKLLPAEEKFAMVSQIRRAALSVSLNLSEGASRRSSAERIRFYEISRGSLIEVDTAIDVAVSLEYLSPFDVQKLGELIVNTFKLLTGLIANGK